MDPSPIYAEHRRQHDTGKRLFIGLLLGTAAIICSLFLAVWLVPTLGFAHFPWLPILVGIVATSAVLLVFGVATWLTVCAWFGQHGYAIPGAKPLWRTVSRILLPLMESVGRLLHISSERVRRSFIKVNNEIVLGSGLTCRPEETLILLPHCIQASHCDRRLTYSLTNCRRCGKCPISDLIDLRDAWGIKLAVAVGGSIARRIVVQQRPKLIIAVACERDLSSGIQDTAPLPVYGIINRRPHGPCMDTEVNLSHLKTALEYFVHPIPPRSTKNNERFF